MNFSVYSFFGCGEAPDPGGHPGTRLGPWGHSGHRFVALARPGTPRQTAGTAECTCFSYQGTHLNGCGTLPLDETDECTLFPSLLAGRIVFSVARDVWRSEGGREGRSHAGHCGKFLRKIRVLCTSGTPQQGRLGGCGVRLFVCGSLTSWVVSVCVTCSGTECLCPCTCVCS